MFTCGSFMDEFKPKKIELLQSQNSTSSAQDLLKLLNNGELEVDHTIFEENIMYTPEKKLAYLMGGVLLMVTVLGSAPGYFIIRYIVRLGPIWSTTQTITCTHYLAFNHSIIKYEYKNNELVDVILTKLNIQSYVGIGNVSTGEYGSSQEFCLYVGGSEVMELWSSKSLKSNYQNVKEFCEISGLDLRISDNNRKKFDLF